MEIFAPLINLLILLSVLSITAERLTNTFKLRRPGMRQPLKQTPGAKTDQPPTDEEKSGKDPTDEKDRERQILQASLGVCLLLAVLVKADLFAILARLDAPWETIGWLTQDPAGGWVRSDALASCPVTPKVTQ